MKILEKLLAKRKDIYGAPGVTIAFLGDSVTQGCFEVYKTDSDSIETVFDPVNAYSMKLRELLAVLYPNVQVNIINSGISGDSAANGAIRLERDILRYQPDLVVVSYGLNDSTLGRGRISEYTDALAMIFERLKAADIECIFLTENMMNTYVSSHIQDENLRKTAQAFADIENSGTLSAFFQAAKKVAVEYNVPVCDCYARWRRMFESGVDTTELLANHLNHPITEMTNIFANSLLECFFN